MTNVSSNVQKWLVGDWNTICDTCGRKRKRSECQLSFGSGDIAVFVTCIDGCSDDRHPLNDPPPIIFDGQPVPDARPEGQDVFITIAQKWDSADIRFGVNDPHGLDNFNDDVNWENS